MHRVFSTRELAALCRVNESTIKRWADSGRLLCVKTPGGHRKFKTLDVVVFMQKHGYDPSLLGAVARVSAALPSNLDLLIRDKANAELAAAFLQGALEGGHRAARLLLLRLLSSGYSAVEICDNVLAPACSELAARRGHGSVSAVDESLFVSAALEALVALGAEAPRCAPRPYRAFCCPCPSAAHGIGARMIGMALESIGWDVAVTVQAAPFDELARYLDRQRPHVLCLCAGELNQRSSLPSDYEAVWDSSRRAGTQIAVGGWGDELPGKMRCDFRSRSLSQLVQWATALDESRSATPSRGIPHDAA